MPKFRKSAQDWFSNKRWATLLEQVRLAFETRWTEIEKLLDSDSVNTDELEFHNGRNGKLFYFDI